MGFKLTALGRVLAMDTFTGQGAAPLYAVGLFKNNLTPTGAEVTGDFTPADFDGYAEINVPSWSNAVDSGGVAASFGGLCLFVASGPFTTPNDIYGYFLRNRTTGEIMGSERFATGTFAVDAAGKVVPVIPRFGQQDV